MMLIDAPSMLDSKGRELLDKAIELYGDDSNEVLNALHSIAAAVGIAAGVQPCSFTEGMAHHWNYFALILHEAQEGTDG